MDSIKKKVIAWNNRFPVDYWWRKKHNITFMSSQHRESNFWDQLFEYYEDTIMQELYNPKDKYEVNLNQYLRIKDDVDNENLEENEDYALKELDKYKSLNNGD